MFDADAYFQAILRLTDRVDHKMRPTFLPSLKGVCPVGGPLVHIYNDHAQKLTAAAFDQLWEKIEPTAVDFPALVFHISPETMNQHAQPDLLVILQRMNSHCKAAFVYWVGCWLFSENYCYGVIEPGTGERKSLWLAKDYWDDNVGTWQRTERGDDEIRDMLWRLISTIQLSGANDADGLCDIVLGMIDAKKLPASLENACRYFCYSSEVSEIVAEMKANARKRRIAEDATNDSENETDDSDDEED